MSVHIIKNENLVRETTMKEINEFELPINVKEGVFQV